jgi:hypothetical protein
MQNILQLKKMSSLLLIFFIFYSCDDGQAELFHGDWQAISITEAGDSMQLNTMDVGFSFAPSGIYNYRSTLRYQEAGRYRYDNGYLFAQDTTKAGAKERIVAIDKLTPDSMIMRMQQDTLERVILFLRE